MIPLPTFSGSVLDDVEVFAARLDAFFHIHHVQSETLKRDTFLLSLAAGSPAELWFASSHLSRDTSYEDCLAALKGRFALITRKPIIAQAARNKLDGRIFRDETHRSEMVLDLVQEFEINLLRAGVINTQEAQQLFIQCFRDFPICTKLLAKSSTYEQAILDALRWEQLIIRKTHLSAPISLTNGDSSTTRWSEDSGPVPAYQSASPRNSRSNGRRHTSPPESPLPPVPTTSPDRPLSTIDLNSAQSQPDLPIPPRLNKRDSSQSFRRVPVPKLPSSPTSAAEGSPTKTASPSFGPYDNHLRPSLGNTAASYTSHNESESEFMTVREDLSRQPSRDSVLSEPGQHSLGQFSDPNESGQTIESPFKLDRSHPYLRNVPIIPFPPSQRPASLRHRQGSSEPSLLGSQEITTSSSASSPAVKRPPTRTPPKKLRRRSVDTARPRTDSGNTIGNNSETQRGSRMSRFLSHSLRRKSSKSSRGSENGIDGSVSAH